MMMTLQEWKDKGEIFKYKRHQVFTIEEGQGEVVLLIHGFPTSSWDWWQMWDGLTSRYRVLTLDMLGFGFSDKPRNYPYSIFDQADLIEQLLLSKEIQNIKILSHDYGDTVAQELLSRNIERRHNKQQGVEIESLCLLNGGIFPEAHQPLFIQKVLMSPIGSIVSRLFNRQKLGRNFKKIFGPHTQPTEHELDDFWHIISNNGGKYIFHLLIRYMQERQENRPRWIGALQNADIPIRLINGLFDPISGQQMVDRYIELISNHDVVKLENIGHFPLIEAPDAILKHFLEFIDNEE